MAELGVLANLVGVVGAGLKLSVALYDFARTLGSAGREIEDMGYDITLLCAVLKRVQLTLDSPKATRLSGTAIQTTQDIVNRCQKILDDIKDILKKLRKDGQSNIDVLARVKWTLKRPKILMLRDWARNATIRLLNTSTNREPDPEHDQDLQMTQSLFLAQQSANHRLEELEDRAINEDTSPEDSIESPNSLSPSPSSPLSLDTFARHRRNRSSTMIDTVVYPAFSTSSADKRTSVLLNECVFETDRSFDPARQGRPRTFDRRQSLVYSEALLRRWTKQLDSTPTAGLHIAHGPLQRESPIEPILESRYSLDTEVESEPHPGPRDQIPQTRLTFSDLPKVTAENSNEVHVYRPRGSSEFGSPDQTPKSMNAVGTPPNVPGPAASPDNIHRVGFDFQPSMQDEIELRAGQLVRVLYTYDDEWALCSRLDSSEGGVAPRECLSSNPVKPGLIENNSHTYSNSSLPEGAKAAVEPQTASDLKDPGDPSLTTPPVEIFKSFRVGLDDRLYKVLPAALRKYQIRADWRTYALYIVYRDQERNVGLEEKPLALFKGLVAEGKQPVFMLRKLAGINESQTHTAPEGGLI